MRTVAPAPSDPRVRRCARRSPPRLRLGRSGAAPRERTLFVSAVDKERRTRRGPRPRRLRGQGRRRAPRSPARLARHRARSTSPCSSTTAPRQRRNHLLPRGLSKFVAKMAPGNKVAVITPGRPAHHPRRLHDDTQAPQGRGRPLFPMPQSGMTLLDAHHRDVEGPGAARDAARRHRAGHHRRRRVHQPLLPRRRRRADQGAARAAHRRHRPVLPLGRARHARALVPARPRARARRGGQRITLLSPHGLDQALERLARELSSQYKVVYGRPSR